MDYDRKHIRMYVHIQFNKLNETFANAKCKIATKIHLVQFTEYRLSTTIWFRPKWQVYWIGVYLCMTDLLSQSHINVPLFECAFYVWCVDVDARYHFALLSPFPAPIHFVALHLSSIWVINCSRFDCYLHAQTHTHWVLIEHGFNMYVYTMLMLGFFLYPSPLTQIHTECGKPSMLHTHTQLCWPHHHHSPELWIAPKQLYYELFISK